MVDQHVEFRRGVRSSGNVRSVVMTGDISLRTARAADYDGIIAVVDDWWGRPVRAALPRLFLDHFHDTSFIAERSGGELAGFLIGFGSPAQRDCAYIQFVGVAPQERGSGLARLLYQAFFDIASVDGRRVVRAVTAPVNSASIAFHTAMGFTVTGPVDNYDGPSDAKMLFERQLD
jgi:predicted GNAT superfamily acetyltransferase